MVMYVNLRYPEKRTISSMANSLEFKEQRIVLLTTQLCDLRDKWRGGKPVHIFSPVTLMSIYESPRVNDKQQ